MIRSLFLLTLPILVSFHSPTSYGEAPVDIGQQRELFVDDHLVHATEGITFQLHQAEPQEVVLVTDKPWEGNTCAYYTIFQDGEKYRMYYRGSHWDEKAKQATHPEVVCYAESNDGIHWRKPELGICEFNGSTANNIVWDGVGTHNFTPFKDANPKCKPDAKYKALARGRSLKKGDKSSQHGLFAFQSADGLHWKLMRDTPVITEGAFDSQNLAFYDPLEKQYRDYHRWFNQGIRDIMVCTSPDFVNWTKPIGLQYTEAKREHLYTNAIQRYPRAPHFFIGFPTRYLPDEGQRVEPVMMASRDGLRFKRWAEPVIPETAPKDRKGNRSNYMAWGLVQLPENNDEYSVYATEAYYTGPDSRVRRFTYRVDGFVSAHAGKNPGHLTTRSIIFDGKTLELNLVTGEKGFIAAEIQDLDGNPIPGFSLNDCDPCQGDSISKQVSWKKNASLQALTGRAVRLHFSIRNSDLYSFQFINQE